MYVYTEILVMVKVFVVRSKAGSSTRIEHAFFIFLSYFDSQFLLIKHLFKGVLHPWTLFLKKLRIFSKNTATLDKASNGSD